MRTPIGQRPSGIGSMGDLPWGSHFCVFYASQRELLEVLVPFIKAGLECNELCSWEVHAPLTIEAATAALTGAVPELERYVALGQVEIVSPLVGFAALPRPDERLERKLDRAILAGFDGLRLVRHAVGKEALGVTDVESIGRLDVIAAFLYPRTELGVVGLMERVQDHRLALVCNSGRWEVLKGSGARTAADALKRSEDKLQSLFQNMSEGFAYHRIVLDAQGRPCDYVFLEVNRAFERLTGLVAQQILGRRVTQVLPGVEKDPTDWIGKYGRVALTGEPVQFESHSAVLDRWYAVSAFCPHEGYFAVTFADVTDRKRAEAQRRAAEERLLVTLRSIGDAVISTDTAGRATMLNRVAEELTGFTQEEAAGKPLREVFNVLHEETGAPVEDPVRKVIERGGIVGLANHTVLVRRDGRRISIADSAAPVRSDGGELLGVVLVFRDVTDERLAERRLAMEKVELALANEIMQASERALRASEARFRLLSDSASLLLATNEPQAVVSKLCHEVMEHLDCQTFFNYLADPGAGKLHLNACAGIPDVEARRIEWLDYGVAVCGCVARDQQRIIAEDILRSSDRRADLVRSFGIQAYCCHPLVAEGQLLGTLSFGTKTRPRFCDGDVALMKTVADQVGVAMQRIQAQRALREANQRLQEADRRKDEFLAVLSHELRNPLAPVRNSIYILRHADPGSERAARAQSVIERQTEHLTRLVDDLLDVTRIARGKVELRPSRSELRDLVLRAAEDFHSTMHERGIAFRTVVPEAGIWAEVDATRVTQVVGNLLHNAAKFTPRGGEVTLSLWPIGGAVEIRVRDTGAGIDASLLPHVFDAFVQGERTLARTEGGLGLGLALVKGITELHGGAVRGESAGNGMGSEFVVRLPLGGPAAARDVSPEDGRRTNPGRRVLVVDDNVDAAQSLAEIVEMLGHAADVAYDGPNAIAKVRANPPDIVLCDIGLPGMSGYEIAQALRRAGHGMQLFAISGYTQPEDVKSAVAAGFDGHVAKPVEVADIKRLLAEAPASSS